MSVRVFAWLACLLPLLSCGDPVSPMRIPGRPILFVAHTNWIFSGRATRSAIYAMRADGSGIRLITQGAWPAFYPSWSRDGARVAFASGGGGISPAQALWVMNPDGSDAHLASSAFPTCGYGYKSLTWAPSGERLAASCLGNTLIFDLRNGESYSLSERLGTSTSNPDWSPDGKRIALSGPDGDEVLVTNPDGTGLAPLLSNAAVAVWSPNGEKLAFLTVEDGRLSIMVANSDGSHRVRIAPDSIAYSMGPTWSPDGQWLAFPGGSNVCTNVGSPPSEYCYTHRSIYTVRADGTGLRRITPDSLEASSPAW